LSEWKLILNYTGHTAPVYGLEWLDTDILASGSFDRTIHIWAFSTAQAKIKLKINTNVAIYSLKMLNNKIHLAVGLTREIKIYNVNNGFLVATLRDHTSNVEDIIQISDDLLASASDDFTVRLWDLTTFTCKFVLEDHAKPVYALKKISSELIASGDTSGIVIVWDVVSGIYEDYLEVYQESIYFSLDLINNGRVVVSGFADGTLQFWDWSTREFLNNKETKLEIYALSVINQSKLNFFEVEFS